LKIYKGNLKYFEPYFLRDEGQLIRTKSDLLQVFGVADIFTSGMGITQSPAFSELNISQQLGMDKNMVFWYHPT
jgi:hypothetical protein